MPDFLCNFVMAEVVVTVMVTLYPGIFFNLSLITILFLFRKCIQQNNLPVWYEMQVSHATAVVKVTFGGGKGLLYLLYRSEIELGNDQKKKNKKTNM